jgi:hypothetical protein
MQYFMGVGITILKDSQEIIMKRLRNPMQYAYAPKVICRLINMQIKQIMYTLIKNTYTEVLGGLEKLLIKPTRSWATSFCVIMILRMCAEMVQRTTDARIISRLDNQDFSQSRNDSIGIIRKLDDFPITYISGIFHAAFKTKKARKRKAQEERLNPPQGKTKDTNNESQAEHPTRRLIETIRSIMAKYGLYISA